eukprot:scaffold42705_cov54-Phaeocystis_antarctica.AAC.1
MTTLSDYRSASLNRTESSEATHPPSGSAPNVTGTPTLGMYQPRAFHSVAPTLLPGLRARRTHLRTLLRQRVPPADLILAPTLAPAPTPTLILNPIPNPDQVCRLINHSDAPNARLVCVVHDGAIHLVALHVERSRPDR